MKKRVIALVLVLVLSLGVLAGCGNSGKKEETKGSTDKKYSIGVLIFDYANDYISYVRKGLEAAATEAGVEFTTSDGKNDQPTQTEQIDTYLSKGVDGFCIAPVESAAAETILAKIRAAKDGTPVVFVNKQPTKEVLNSYDKTWFVGCATKMPGVQEFQMIEQDWKADPTMDKNGDGKIQYVVIKGENGHENSEKRIEGMEEVIKASDLTWDRLDLQVAGWNTQKAKDLMDAWISKFGDQIEVVASQNDAMAMGAIEALKAVGYFEGDKKIAVYGINCLQIALESMERGELRGSVMTDMLKEGRTTFTVLYNVLQGKQPGEGLDAEYETDTKCFRVPTVPVRLSNIDDAKAMYK